MGGWFHRNRDRYPPDWDAIAESKKQEAGYKCEHCGHPHDPGTGRTLTVHHLDGDPANVADDNLVALCQKCHLHIQGVYQPGQGVFPFAQMEWQKKRGLVSARKPVIVK